jgi:hypothetical protein
MTVHKVRKVAIYLATGLLAVFLLRKAELTIRNHPEFMLPEWQIRYHTNRATKAKVVPDTDLGFLMAPNQREPIQARDFSYVRETDSKGFPNRDPWPAQADIVFLGDSLVVGEGVGLADSFPQLIAKMLPKHSLVNLGVPGAGVERQARIYRRFGLGLHPRWVVGCLYLAADFRNDLLFRSWLRQGRNTIYDGVEFRRTQETRSEFNLERLFERSWLLGMGRELARRAFAGENRLPDRYDFADGSEILLNRAILELATEAVPVNDERLEAMLRTLQDLRAEVARHDGQFMLMLIPSKEELFGLDARAMTMNAMARARERLEQQQFAVLDLYPVIRSAGARRSPYFTIDIHLNKYGNRIVAEQFVAWFQKHAISSALFSAAKERVSGGTETAVLR